MRHPVYAAHLCELLALALGTVEVLQAKAFDQKILVGDVAGAHAKIMDDPGANELALLTGTFREHDA